MCIGQKLIGCRLLAGPKLNIGNRYLAGVNVRPTYRCDERNGRMLLQAFFDQARINVVPSPNDQLLSASSQPKVAVRVDAP